MAYTAIDDPSAYFKVQLYTGNGTAIGSGGNAITFNDTDTDMQPDMVWLKSRSSVEHHMLFDAVRGVTKALKASATDAEATGSEFLTAFGSDGFTLGSHDKVNANTVTYAAWCWKEASGIFDIVSYTGNGSARTISHNLSAVPRMMLVKRRDSTSRWSMYLGVLGDEKMMELNTTDTVWTNRDEWNEATPTSSVFPLGTGGDAGDVNTDSATYVNYLWSEKQGFSKFGSYIGNGNADGTFVYTGFKPAFLIAKRTDATNSWHMWDNKRDGYNESNEDLRANMSAAEGEGNVAVDLLSNGFKWLTTDGAQNASGGTYIYMAFAEAPFVNSNGVPCNAR